MGLLKTYDAKAISLDWNGVNITSGLAPDTFITVSRDEDSFFKTVGADGQVVRTRNANRAGTIELTLMQNSEVNKALMLQALLDEESGTTDVTNVFSVSDPSDPTGVFLTTAKDCWVKKIPDIELGKEYGTRTWMFDVANLSIANEVRNLVE